MLGPAWGRGKVQGLSGEVDRIKPSAGSSVGEGGEEVVGESLEEGDVVGVEEVA